MGSVSLHNKTDLKHSGVVLMGHNKPLREANIKITRKRFNSYEKKPFSLGEKHRGMLSSMAYLNLKDTFYALRL